MVLMVVCLVLLVEAVDLAAAILKGFVVVMIVVGASDSPESSSLGAIMMWSLNDNSTVFVAYHRER